MVARGSFTLELLELELTFAKAGKPGARLPLTGPLGTAIGKAAFVQKIRSAWPKMRPVRLVSFEKRSGVNWGVPWHQDRVIAVQDRADIPGYSNWSRKSGLWHCEPPTEILQRMLFVRVHIDRNTEQNGAMEIARGSHAAGKVEMQEAQSVADCFDKELALASVGDVLILNMMTLHRSMPSHVDEPRRVVRVDFSPDFLPAPLKWAD